MSDLNLESKRSWAVRHLEVLTVFAGLAVLCISPLLRYILLQLLQCFVENHPQITWLIDRSSDLLNKIGDATIIAGLIGIIVDHAQKTRLIRDVVEAASPELIGRHLPVPIRKALLGYLYETIFVRPTFTIQFELAPIQGAPGYLKVTSRIEGPILNYGSQTKEFVFSGSIDPSPHLPQLGQSRITRVSITPETGEGGFDENPPADNTLPDGTKWFSKSVAMPSGVRYRTVLETLEYRPTSYVMPLFTGTAITRALVTIRYPKELLDIQVSTGSSENITPEANQWGKEWVIATALLPGQCIMTTWNPKSVVGP